MEYISISSSIDFIFSKFRKSIVFKRSFLIETNDLPLRCDEPNSPYPNDKIHFNTFGILELGNRLAQKVDEALNEK